MQVNENLKTPYYVIDKENLDNNFNNLKSALEKYWNNYIIGYSYKTNSLPWLIQYFDKKGCFSEVVSDDEYELGKLLNISKNKFIYNGPIKTEDTFLEAAENQCYINIDSYRELEWTKKLKGHYKLGIRVNFDIEKYCFNQSQCGSEGGRFGFCYENGEFEKALNYLIANDIKISGIHLHTSSKTRSLEIYTAICDIAVQIIKKYNLNLEYIDVGGGFFGSLKDKPQYNDYLNAISKVLSQVTSIEKTKLIVEPGMCLVGSPIDYICSVIDVKDTTYNRFVITDGSRTNIDPFMKKNTYFHEYNYCNDNRKIIKKQVICGYTCMENDRFLIEEDKLELQVNDKIVFEKVGAYTMCLTPLFIKYFPDVFVLENNNFKKVRSSWDAQQYIQNCSKEGEEN